jgi:spore coat protein A
LGPDTATSPNHPLTPFVDELTFPPRRVVSEPGRLVVRLEPATHRFHRDLPPSRVWTYDGSVPGPTVEVRRGVRLEVLWENRLGGPFPVNLFILRPHLFQTFQGTKRISRALKKENWCDQGTQNFIPDP